MGNYSERIRDIEGAKSHPAYFAKCPPVELPKHSDNPMVLMGGGATLAPAIEAFKSLRTRLVGVQASRGIRSVAVTSAVQSDGKTLTSFNLACCCAQLEDTPVLLVDGDLRTRGLTELIGMLPQSGLADVLSGSVTYDHAVARTDLPNLCVMGAGSSEIGSAELLSSDRWKRFMEWSSSCFKLVLVDSLPMGSVADCDLIAAGCDSILVVVRAQSTPRGALEKALEQIDPSKLIGVVWNGATMNNSSQKVYAHQSSRTK
jgi:tyrosine-protein kinase Etk/Wzc